MSTGETVPLQKEERESSFFILVHITAIARTWGLITSVVMWVAAVVMIDDNKRGFNVFYLITVAIIVSFFEITWVLNKCACCGHEGCCCRLWRAIMWVDTWKKFFFYVALSVPLFLEGKKEALCIVTGFMLIILSTIYLVKTFVGHVSYSRIERSQVITGSVSSVAVTQQTITHETSTQTDVNGQPGQTP